ncbi:MAG: archease [Acidimicrobiales bacterium]
MTTTGYVSGHVPEERGSRLAAHTADCIIEAWGADRVGCLEEAVGALVSVFAEVPDVPRHDGDPGGPGDRPRPRPAGEPA